MTLEMSVSENEPHILVEGPQWADTEFYGNWLLAAAKADALWKKAISDPVFKEQVEQLTIVRNPDFNISACVLLSRLEKKLASFTIGLDSWEAEEFVVMAGMGFFVLTGQRYQMVVPTQLNISDVKKAALKLVQTQDEEDNPHPEYLLATMSSKEAEAWQQQLLEMGDDHRCADRFLALKAKTIVSKKRQGCVWWGCRGIPLLN
jgi:hypothetical protein